MQKTALILSFLLGLYACKSKETTKSIVSTPSYTLIFIDKSQSINLEKPFIKEKYEKILQTAIDDNIRGEGDKLEIYYIHENTAKAKALSLTARTKKMNIQHMNPTDLEAAKNTYEVFLKKEKRYFLSQSVSKLQAANTQESNRATDVLGSIPIMAQANASGMVVKAYFLSDMLESSALAGGHTFERTPPKNAEEANKLAETDAKRLENNALNGVDVYIALPFEATSSIKENNPNVSTYWKILFEKLGVMTVSEL